MKRLAFLAGAAALAFLGALLVPVPHVPAQTPIGGSLLTPGLGSVASGQPLTITCPNDGTTGTTNGLLVKVNSSGNCINATVNDFNVQNPSSIFGVVVSGGGTTGSALVAIGGVVACTFDTTATTGDLVSGSHATAGNCADIAPQDGSTLGGTTMGVVVDGGGAAGSHRIFIVRQFNNRNVLWGWDLRIDMSAFAGQMLIRRQDTSAGVSMEIGGNTSSNPCIGDSGALLKIMQAGAGSCANDGNLGVGHLSSDNAAPPTIASGFGTSPSIVSGGDTAFIVNVGTGGTATSGVVNFGTSYTTAPACMAEDVTNNVATRVSASTSQATVTAAAAWTASDKVAVHCFGQNGL